jgi:hypothetical protein
MFHPFSYKIGGLTIFTTVLFFFFFAHNSEYASSSAFSSGPTAQDHPKGSSYDVANGTLGFEKIYVVNLRERSDKRDAMTLASSLTNFKIEWRDGVMGEDVPDKAVPFGTTREGLWNNNLGSWRAHMNTVRQYV